MAKKNHFDMNMGLDMSSMTDLVTQVEKAADPASIVTEEVQEESLDVEPIQEENSPAKEVRDFHFDEILKEREKKTKKWCPITIAEEQLAILNALKKYSKDEISIRDILYNIVDNVLSQHNDKIKDIIKKVEKAEIKKIQERLKNYA